MQIELSKTPVQELKTIRDFIRFAVTQFYAADLYYGHGTDNAWDEARWLMSHVTHLPVVEMDHVNVQDARLLSTEKKQFCQWVDLRVRERLPVAYLLNESWFAGLPFYVNKNVLIPRSPIAELIEQQFTPWMEVNHIHRLLDIGTGSGCIGIAAAHYLPEALIDALDISPKAIEIAKQNAHALDVTERVTCIVSDLFSELPKQAQYDIIISNPPYVPLQSWQNLPKEYQHEPKSALYADNQGLAIVQRILNEAHHYLRESGILIVEVGEAMDALIALYPDVSFTWLEFERGGEGVFLLTKKQLDRGFHAR